MFDRIGKLYAGYSPHMAKRPVPYPSDPPRNPYQRIGSRI